MENVFEKKKIFEENMKITFILYPRKVRKTEDQFAIFEGISESGKRKTFKASSCSIVIGNSYNIQYKEGEKYKNRITYDALCVTESFDFESTMGLSQFLKKVTSESLAKKIIDTFGADNVKDILESENAKERLLEIKGIGKVLSRKIVDKYKRLTIDKEAYLTIGEYGFKPEEIERLLKVYKSPSKIVDIVKDNIYDLVGVVERMTFLTIDKIALLNDYAEDDPRRLSAAVIYVFQKGLENHGWSWMKRSQFLELANKESKVPYIETYIEEAFDQMFKDGVIRCVGRFKGEDVYSLEDIYQVELNVMECLDNINNNEIIEIDVDKVTETIFDIESETGYQFSDEQIEFVTSSCNKPLTLLTGFAGTGKTTVAYALARSLKEATDGKATVYGCALSGRAAANLKDSLKGVQIACTTIAKVQYDEGLQDLFKNASLVIVDESTMIGGEEFLKLLSFVGDNTRLLLMGDVRQLPPIGNCQIYRDALLSKKYHTAVLSKSFRQNGNSGILSYSRAISDGDIALADQIAGNSEDVDLISAYDMDQIAKRYHTLLKENADLDPMRVQVCVAQIKEYEAINQMVHDLLVDEGLVDDRKYYTFNLSPDKEVVLCVGDKVINRKNLYSGVVDENDQTIAVMNGDMGVIKGIDKTDDSVSILVEFSYGSETQMAYFDEETCIHLRLGYACTCHSLQGSGFDYVIVGISNHCYYKMYNQEWFYTAVTRAKKNLTVFYDSKFYKMAISTKAANEKQTLLLKFLNQW